jgi:hypothetical protein
MIATVAQTLPNHYLREELDLNVSSIALTLQNVNGEWDLIQDYRSKSVLSGLSATGGLGSLLSTILVMFLGMSLLGAVLRTLLAASPRVLSTHS